MAEGLNTLRSAGDEGNHDGVDVNGQIQNGDGENAMEVYQQNISAAAGAGGVVDQSGDAGSGANGGGGVASAQNEEERKITQTDHINKSLLTSFLNRLNDPATANQFPAVQSLDTDFDEDTEPVNL